jgi:hypothetical protein
MVSTIDHLLSLWILLNSTFVILLKTAAKIQFFEEYLTNHEKKRANMDFPLFINPSLLVFGFARKGKTSAFGEAILIPVKI